MTKAMLRRVFALRRAGRKLTDIAAEVGVTLCAVSKACWIHGVRSPIEHRGGIRGVTLRSVRRCRRRAAHRERERERYRRECRQKLRDYWAAQGLSD